MIQTNKLTLDCLSQHENFIKLHNRYYCYATFDKLKRILNESNEIKKVTIVEITPKNIYGFKHILNYETLKEFIEQYPIKKYFKLKPLPTSFEP